MGDLAAARLRFEGALAIVEQLVADDPKNVPQPRRLRQ